MRAAPLGGERPSSAQLATVASAAFAEAAVLCMPVHAALTGAVLGGWPVTAFATAFLVSYAGGVTLVCRYRSVRQVPLVVAVVAIALGALVGGGLTQRGIFTVLVFLVLGVRIVGLGFRDPNIPMSAAFLVGTAALGVETLVGSSTTLGWGRPLVVLIPIFFVSSLTARAILVWSAGDAEDVQGPTRDRSLRGALMATAWIPVAMLAGAILGVKSGVLDRLGSSLAPIGNALASGLVWVFSQLARPVFWLVDRMGIDPEGVRRLFARIQANADAARDRAKLNAGHPSLLGRLIGLILFGLVVWGLVRLLRRLRPDAVGTAGPAEPRPDLAVATAPLTAEAGPEPRRTRRAPPADRVRRWYLETLRVLERSGVRKEASLTPAEFVPEVIRAYPESADAFRALTRAYEDVRYGRLTLDAAALKHLDRQHRSLLESLRRHPPVP